MSAPKFSSFKPKPKAPPIDLEEPPTTRTRHQSGGRPDRTERSHRHHRDDQRLDRHSKHHRRSPNGNGKGRVQEMQDAPFQDELEESNLFIVDRRGDSKNVDYGSLHRYSVPVYHRTGYGRLIGTPSAVKIDRDESSDKSAVLAQPNRSHEQSSRMLLFFKASERKLRFVRPAVVSEELQGQDDFVRLEPSRKRRKLSLSLNETDDLVQIDYRSIEGRAKPDQGLVDDDAQFASDSDADIPAEQEARPKLAALANVTKEQPQNVEAWIRLIDAQASIIKPGADAASLTNTERVTLADLRLSIYDQAMRQITAGKAEHNELLLGMMEEGSRVWDSSKLAAKWKEIVQTSPGSAVLWMKYLDFVQTSKDFRYEQCKAAYMQCLHALYASQISAAGTKADDLHCCRVHILTRFTAFVRDAGYDELASAVWQALLEYHFFKPSSVTSHEEAMSAFEEFWDSDAPRIGEEGAAGWSAFAADPSSGAQRRTSYQRPVFDAAQPFESFAVAESKLLDALHLPASNDDDTAADDPFRYVMFSDLRETIEVMQDELPQTALINGFLTFMGLPLLPSLDGSANISRGDAFLQAPFASQANGYNDVVCVSTEQWIPSTLFDHGFTAFRSRNQYARGEETAHVVRRLLERLITALPSNDVLAEYYVAYVHMESCALASKGAKMLLKARPSSLRLYNAYALSEAHSARLEKAEEVWRTALGMSHTLDEEECDNAVLLWHSWVLTLLRNPESQSRVLRCLLNMFDEQTSTATEVASVELSSSQKLKGTQYFQTSFERMTYKWRYDLAALCAECHMLFVYFANGYDLSAPMTLRKKCSAKLSSPGAAYADEMLHQAQARLLQVHLDQHRPYRPALVRMELSESVRLFPKNSMLLKIYQQMRAPIEGRLRAALADDVLKGPCATVMAWSVTIAEVLRFFMAGTAGMTASSVRNTFKQALLQSDSAAKHSIALWRAWLRFELSTRQTPPIRAKQVFLDGLRFLPWSKSWIIEGLKAFSGDTGGDVMSVNELRQVYDVLAERELRVRMPVDEMEAIAGLGVQ